MLKGNPLFLLSAQRLELPSRLRVASSGGSAEPSPKLNRFPETWWRGEERTQQISPLPWLSQLQAFSF